LQVGGTINWNDLTNDSDVFSGGLLMFPKGSRLNASSKYTGSLFAAYTLPLGGSGTLGELSVSGNYISGQSTRGLDALAPSGVYVNYGDNLRFVNAAFTVNFPKDWSMKLYGDNLTNEYGSVLSQFLPGFPPSTEELTPRPRPRTVGLQVDYRYR